MDHPIGHLDMIPRGEGRNFKVPTGEGHAGSPASPQDRIVAVFRTHDDQVFASQPECPHRAGPLADGMLGGTTIMCPLHDRAYDLRTGAVLAGECPIEVYPIRSTPDGTLLLTLP